jgi:hypothetical protein
LGGEVVLKAGMPGLKRQKVLNLNEILKVFIGKY